MIGLHRIHHVALTVANLDTAVVRWANDFGLVERCRQRGVARLACDFEPYSIELIEGSVGGYHHAAYELSARTSLDAAADHLDGLGIAVARRGETLWLADPDGQAIELLAFDPQQRERIPAHTRQTTALGGYRMRKLGHVNSTTGKLRAMTDFYVSALGMDVSDVLDADGGVWLNCNSDHHVQALVATGSPHFHHLAFELVDWSDLRVALDHLCQRDRWVPWGPLRHSVGRNIAAYVRIPEEACFVELYADMEILQPDHVARSWPDDRRSSNLWGLLPPRTYFRFDAEAIEAERVSSVMFAPLSPAES